MDAKAGAPHQLGCQAQVYQQFGDRRNQGDDARPGTGRGMVDAPGIGGDRPVQRGVIRANEKIHARKKRSRQITVADQAGAIGPARATLQRGAY
ncbi:hypothetical protein SDC9_190408 [bioreactor metagenome]|uniref:Uncharacterized protein n=1 Tax=bioreactor metagenome TaxID=1076179 RepID=A0A645HVH3_9ZZZZ